MRLTKFSEFLRRSKIPIEIDDSIVYKRVTIRGNHGGISLRDFEKGKNIGTKKQFILKSGQFVLSKIDARFGAFGIAPSEVEGAIITGNFWAYDVDFNKVNIEWFNRLTNSKSFYELCERASSGITHRKYLNESSFLNNEIFLPTIEEQFMQIERIKNLQLDFNGLFSEQSYQLALIKKLRQQILKDAIQGKLVPQDKNDEPTSELLKRIKAEKSKSNKKKKPLPPIKQEEIPFEIPKNWVWCRLGEICDKIGSGSTPKGSNYSNEGFPFFRSQNIYDEGLQYDDIKFIAEEVQEKMKGTCVVAKDLLLNITGGSLGRCALVPNEFKYGNVSQHVCIIRPINVNNRFLHSVIQSPIFQKFIFTSTTGAGREGLPKYNLEKFPIPLPPLREQQRIVSRIEELMALCDKLETSVKTNQEYTQSLYQTALKDALQPKKEVVKEVKAKVIGFIPKICNDPEKAILAGHIINTTNNEDFGRVKFQKLLHLTEYFCKIDMGSNYIQKVAGPHDDNLIKSVESTLKRLRFYEIKQQGFHAKVNYTPLGSASELDSLFKGRFKSEEIRIDSFLNKFKKSSWEQCEIVSTLYAVWNNRIIKQQLVTDDLLKQDFLNWDKNKEKYKDRLDNALAWMRDKNIIPDGWGKYIGKPIENK